MRNHYIPRFYLKGFTIQENDKMIFCYRCISGDSFRTNTINIGQETNFYSDKVEKFLTEEIEEPAKNILNKIKAKDKLTDEDKVIFTNYLVMILIRVPSFLDLVKTKYPDSIHSIKRKLKSQGSDMLNEGEIDEVSWNKKNKLIDVISEEFLNDNERVKDYWQDYLRPENFPKIQNEIFTKKWMFLTSKEDHFYLTCDNPFFFDKNIGIANTDFTFPITKEYCLLAINSSDNFSNYYVPRTQTIKKINKRSIANAKNFVYSPKDEEWIQNIIGKRERLNLDQLSLRGP